MEPAADRRHATWDLRAGPGNYFWIVTSQIATAGLSVLSVWMATTALGPTGYGSFAAILAAGHFVGQLAIDWSAVSLVRYGCSEFIDTGRLSTAFWTRLAILIAAAGVVAATSHWWWPALARVLHLPDAVYLPTMMFGLGTAMWLHVQASLQAAKLPRLRARLLTVERVLIIVILGLFWWQGPVSPARLVVTYVLASLTTCGVGLYFLRGIVFPGVRVDLALLRRMLTFSLPLVPAAVLGYFSSNYVDALFITHYLTMADLGRFTVAYQLTAALMQLPNLLGSLVLPFFVSLDLDRSRAAFVRLLDDALPLMTLGWSVLCVIAAAAGAWVIPLVLGPPFAAAVPLLWPLVAAAAFAGPVLTVYITAAQAQSLTFVNAVSATAAAVANVGMNAVLIPRVGLIGCAWATACAYGMSLLVWVWFVHHRDGRGHGRVVEATLPAVSAAICATLTGSDVLALGVALVVALLVALVRRDRMAAGLSFLQEVRART